MLRALHIIFGVYQPEPDQSSRSVLAWGEIYCDWQLRLAVFSRCIWRSFRL